MGIAAEDQVHLFGKFYRVNNKETRAQTGTGLGLWITKQIVDTMHGNISVESIKGVGSHFVVSFPLAK
jgi:signal transduction histidine kinase